MADQRKHVIVIVPSEDQRGFLVVLMHSEDGNIDWDNEETFVLTQRPTHEDAHGYAVGLANMIRLEVLEIRAT